MKGINSENLHNKITEILPAVKGRPRIFGYDIEFESTELEFYINTYDEKEFQIDITTSNENKFFDIMEKLKNILIEMNGLFDLVYFKEDKDGNQKTDDKVFFNNLN
ncbi:hypothetical protein [Cellulophaga baltica]|uniref:hypothetical protein n=1 Tax=Cellulophaga baltica TaxID=76594 RepID=UPI0015F58DE7|nr:hypothetical protein [Cellulophaga baltica]MBA6316895.1 hypothetical protein [Cellulophaga baltica]